MCVYCVFLLLSLVAGYLFQPKVLHWWSESLRREPGHPGRLLAGGSHSLPHPGPDTAGPGERDRGGGEREGGGEGGEVRSGI